MKYEYQIQVEDILNPLLDAGCRVFSVVGSGGKTTFIRRAALYYGAREAYGGDPSDGISQPFEAGRPCGNVQSDESGQPHRSALRVGVAASTKMLLPDEQWQCGGIMPAVLTPASLKAADISLPPVCFYGEHILPEGKLWDIGPDMIELAMARSDLLLIEADGSKKKPLKGWRGDEPVIVPQTDVTIGILPLHCLGRIIHKEMVHRMESFTAITGLGCGDRMDTAAYMRLIIHPNGLFGHGRGRRVLVLNRADSPSLLAAAEEIINKVKQSGFALDGWALGCLDEV